MKLNCEIIRDLIPSYVDGCLSEESRKAVDEHLQDCPECREYLKTIREACKALDADNVQTDFSSEGEALKKAKRVMTRRKIVTIVISIAITITAVLLIGNTIIHTLKESVISITDPDQITVSYDDDGNLIAEINGPAVYTAKILNLTLDNSGQKVSCLVFGAETTRWYQMTAADNEFTRMILVYADKGASDIDRVYYLSPKEGAETDQFASISYAESVTELKDASLIYQKD